MNRLKVFDPLTGAPTLMRAKIVQKKRAIIFDGHERRAVSKIKRSALDVGAELAGIRQK